MKIYLDVCCLNRPFDDAAQDRVRIESEAVLTILSRCQSAEWILLSSEVVDIEISKIPDDERMWKVSFLSSISQSYIVVDKDVKERAMELSEFNFKSFDALHIACAEKGGADVLLTTDDTLLNKASQQADALKVRLENPVTWLMEESEK
jgi:predicted nucleic acid-binding protein